MAETTIYCPFCEKQTVLAFHRPAYRKRDHASQYSSKKDEEFIIMSGCSNCGKTLEEIKAKI